MPNVSRTQTYYFNLKSNDALSFRVSVTDSESSRSWSSKKYLSVKFEIEITGVDETAREIVIDGEELANTINEHADAAYAYDTFISYLKIFLSVSPKVAHGNRLTIKNFTLPKLKLRPDCDVFINFMEAFRIDSLSEQCKADLGSTFNVDLVFAACEYLCENLKLLVSACEHVLTLKSVIDANSLLVMHELKHEQKKISSIELFTSKTFFQQEEIDSLMIIENALSKNPDPFEVQEIYLNEYVK
jgi:hypothetical protein